MPDMFLEIPAKNLNIVQIYENVPIQGLSQSLNYESLQKKASLFINPNGITRYS